MCRMLPVLLVVLCSWPLPPGRAAERPAAGVRSEVDAEAVLRGWEAASSRLSPLTAGQKERAWLRQRAERSGHEFALMCELCGPVRADDLRQRYRWTVTDESDRIVLTGKPRDVPERLFYREFVVTLDAATFLPTDVQFSDRRGSPRSGPVRLAAYQVRRDDGPPPSPVELAGYEGPGRIHAARFPLPLSEEQTQAAPVAAARRLDPKVEMILKQWAQAASEVRTLQAGFRRFTYDHVFDIDRRAEGRLYWESSGNGCLEVRSAKLSKADAAGRHVRGRPFRVKSDLPERWIWTDGEFRMINDAERTCEVFTLPSPVPRYDERPWYKRGFPFRPREALPLILESLTVEDLQSHFEWTVLKKTEKDVWLSARPLRRNEAAQWRELNVILDRNSWLPTAVQIIDPGGRLETVYTFLPMAVNQPLPEGDDPLHPDLTGYQIIEHRPR